MKQQNTEQQNAKQQIRWQQPIRKLVTYEGDVIKDPKMHEGKAKERFI